MLLFDRVRGVCDYADLADTSNCLLERESTNNEKKKKKLLRLYGVETWNADHCQCPVESTKLKNIDCLQLPQSFALEMRHQM